jgi:hypothetical protein
VVWLLDYPLCSTTVRPSCKQGLLSPEVSLIDPNTDLKILKAKRFIALAIITEAFAGSDVGSLQTTAVREGDFWIVIAKKKYVSRWFDKLSTIS